jgi:hypothetical protein
MNADPLVRLFPLACVCFSVLSGGRRRSGEQEKSCIISRETFFCETLNFFFSAHNISRQRPIPCLGSTARRRPSSTRAPRWRCWSPVSRYFYFPLEVGRQSLPTCRLVFPIDESHQTQTGTLCFFFAFGKVPNIVTLGRDLPACVYKVKNCSVFEGFSFFPNKTTSSVRVLTWLGSLRRSSTCSHLTRGVERLVSSAARAWERPSSSWN